MLQPGFWTPRLRKNSVQRAKGEVPWFLQRERPCSLQIGGDAQGIPADINGLVHIGSWTFETGRVHFVFCRLQDLAHALRRELESIRNFLDTRPLIEHILRRIVVHLSQFVDVIVQQSNLRLFLGENGFGLVNCPGEAIPVVVH